MLFGGKKPQGKAKAKNSGHDVSLRGGGNVEVDDSLSTLERARAFGESKHHLQRLVYVHELIDTAHDIGYEATVTHVLPVMRKLAEDQEVLVRQSLVGHVGDLAGFLIQSDPENGYQKVVDDLLPMISKLLTERAEEVQKGAAEALTALASHLRPGECGDQVLKEVIKLSQNNEDEDGRSTAAQLLNNLAESLGPDLCTQFVAKEIAALCEDQAFRVRKATAANFAEVSRVVGDDYVLLKLLPAFTKLVQDPHWGVRKATAESLVGLAMSLKEENRERAFVPLMNALLKDVSRWVRVAALQQLGYFIAALVNPSRVPQGLLTQYVDIIEQTKENPDAADVGYHCAYTFAAVVQTMGASSWPTLKVPFTSLCRDTQKNTRKAMAASMHIVAKTLGTDGADEIQPLFEQFLQDNSDDVRGAALKNIAQVLQFLPQIGTQRKLLRSMQGATGKVENWRLRYVVASQLGAICDALGGTQANVIDLAWSAILPIFLQLCADGVGEVRNEAAKATPYILRAAAPEMFVDASGSGVVDGSSGCSSGERQALTPSAGRLVRSIIHGFARGPRTSFRTRQTYVRMCDAVIREVSLENVLTELLVRPLLKLAFDSVKNVRLTWATVMQPHLRRMERLGQTHVVMRVAAKVAKTDKDVEVRRVLSTVPLPDVADIGDVLGPESDFEENEKADGWLASEGGTGDSSECSDVAVGDEDNLEGDSQEAQRAKAATAAAPETVVETTTAAEVVEETKPDDVQNAPASGLAGEEKEPQEETAEGPDRQSVDESEDALKTGQTDSPSRLDDDPVDANEEPPVSAAAAEPVRGFPTPPSSPGSHRIPSSETGPHAYDPVEDTLVSQNELERELDLTFVERRLVSEVKESGDLDLGGEELMPRAAIPLDSEEVEDPSSADTAD